MKTLAIVYDNIDDTYCEKYLTIPVRAHNYMIEVEPEDEDEYLSDKALRAKYYNLALKSVAVDELADFGEMLSSIYGD